MERGARWAGAIAEAKARNETSKLWLHGYWKFDWRDTYIRVDSITPVADPLPGADSTSAYTVTRDASTPPQYPWVSGCRFYATNALSLFEKPQTWKQLLREDYRPGTTPPAPAQSTPPNTTPPVRQYLGHL